MYGAIIGDLIGSRFEFNNQLSKDFDLITEQCEFTDDSVMTCAVAQAILDSVPDYSDLSEKAVAAMQRIGRQYPNCGYGSRFLGWVFSDDPKPYNSCGNGSAMRISAVGFAAENMDELCAMSDAVTQVTHNHPEGMKGAQATAAAILLARQGKKKQEIKTFITGKYDYDLSKTVDTLREECRGHGEEICQVSVPQALICFLEGTDYEDVIRNCISIGGDSDTIAAIAGGIAEAYFGVPAYLVKQCKDNLPPDLLEISETFERSYPGNVIADKGGKDEDDTLFYLNRPLRSMGEYEEIKDLLNFHQFNENSFFGNKLCIDCKFRFSVRKLGSTLYFDERFPFCEKFYHGKPPEIIFHEEGYKCKFFMPESEKDKQE